MGRDLPASEIYEHRVSDYLEDFFKRLGVPYERQPVATLRDNVVARCDLPSARSTVLLEVHQDTVPTDNMTIDPYGATTREGRLYGRGACDVKGGMAAMLTAFSRISRERPAGGANVILACTVDEEYTFKGVQELVKRLSSVDFAVVAEPTQLEIVNAHKGVIGWYVRTLGRSCHSSRPDEGVNAIYRMAGVVVAIEQFAEWLRTSRTDPVLGPPTLSIGRIEGGTSANTVPDRCQIEIDRRLIPGEDPLEASRELLAYINRAAAADLPCEFSQSKRAVPALSARGSEIAVQRLAAAIDQVKGTHRVTAVAYGTDASTIAASGIPAIVFGPGNIANAHTCDESIALDEVEEASEILYQLLRAG
jgi:acetylornithine deacetylase